MEESASHPTFPFVFERGVLQVPNGLLGIGPRFFLPTERCPVCLFSTAASGAKHLPSTRQGRRASGSDFEDSEVVSGYPFRVILNTFSQMLWNSKNATLSSEMLDLGGVGPPFLHDFCLIFECVFSIASETAFLPDFGRVGPSKGVPFGGHFQRFCRFCMKK